MYYEKIKDWSKCHEIDVGDTCWRQASSMLLTYLCCRKLNWLFCHQYLNAPNKDNKIKFGKLNWLQLIAARILNFLELSRDHSGLKNHQPEAKKLQILATKNCNQCNFFF